MFDYYQCQAVTVVYVGLVSVQSFQLAAACRGELPLSYHLRKYANNAKI